MKKILIALLALISIVGVGLFYFSTQLDGIIANTIEKEGSAILGTRVDVDQVVTDIAGGSARVEKVTIANPEGYQADHALIISDVTAKVNYRSQVIENIDINKPEINAELIGTRNNFQDLLNNIPPSDSAEATEDESDLRLTIGQFSLRQAVVNVVTSELMVAGREIDLGERSFVMDDFVLRDLSGTTDEITEVLTRQLTRHVSAQVQAYVAQEVAVYAKDKATEKVTDVLEEKFGDKLKDFGIDLGKD